MTALQTLVVDDSASARSVLKRLLERNGATVEQMESGFQALDYLKSNKPDVIFMDHTMPGMSGLDAVKALRENPNTSNIPVIMCTSQTDDNYRKQALKYGASDVIPKPATWNKIDGALRQISPHKAMAYTIDQKVAAITDKLPETMELQLEHLRQDLKRELKHLVEQHPSNTSPQSLTNLIHSVTDSKIHRLNLELRQQMTTKLDVLLQDIEDEQRAMRQELLLQMEQRFAKLKQNQQHQWAGFNGWTNKWPIITAFALIAGLIVSWPK